MQFVHQIAGRPVTLPTQPTITQNAAFTIFQGEEVLRTADWEWVRLLRGGTATEHVEAQFSDGGGMIATNLRLAWWNKPAPDKRSKGHVAGDLATFATNSVLTGLVLDAAIDRRKNKGKQRQPIVGGQIPFSWISWIGYDPEKNFLRCQVMDEFTDKNQSVRLDLSLSDADGAANLANQIFDSIRERRTDDEKIPQEPKALLASLAFPTDAPAGKLVGVQVPGWRTSLGTVQEA